MTTATAVRKTSRKAASKKNTVTKARPAKKVKKAAARPLLDSKELEAEEKDFRKKYSSIVKGSLRNIGDDPKKDKRWRTKRTVEIKCSKRGCGEVRRIATSDLHQVTMCAAHVIQERLARKRESRKAKAEKPR
jgi:hypothetical protein